jgi:phage baseplate assembly protein W
MASVFDRFKKSIVGSNSQLYDYIPVIDASGDFQRLTGIDAVIYGWNIVLETPTETADHDPKFGCDLYKMVFEPIDQVTKENIIFMVKNQLLAYDSRAEIVSVDVTFSSTKLSFNVDVLVKYLGQEKTLSKTISQKNIPEAR